jgi:hypothetical protein
MILKLTARTQAKPVSSITDRRLGDRGSVLGRDMYISLRYCMPVITNLWFANPLGVRKIFQGVLEKISAMGYFLCPQFDKAESNLVSLAKTHVYKNTSLHCSMTRKTNVYFFRMYLVFCKKKMKHSVTDKYLATMDAEIIGQK